MIISDNRKPSYSEFESLIQRTLDLMNTELIGDPELKNYYLKQGGTKLEEIVKNKLEECARGTAFEATIQLISNQSFPDIVAARHYGVEVKTSQKGWKSTGSSIMESTRIKDVENIFLFFGKLSDPVEFKCKPYQECLSDIVITHKPRYKIDMELPDGETIFDKIEVPYDMFRVSENRIGILKGYYRNILSSGEDLWWLDEGGSEEGNPLVIKLWTTLTPEEKKDLKVQGFCWFPEILGTSTTKYNKFAFWLVQEESIIANSLRDVYSAGGRKDIILEDAQYDDQPKTYYELATLRNEIKSTILLADTDYLKKMWNFSGNDLEGEERLHFWISLVSKQENPPPIELLYDIFFPNGVR